MRIFGVEVAVFEEFFVFVFKKFYFRIAPVKEQSESRRKPKKGIVVSK
jgi:hypothetical protein